MGERERERENVYQKGKEKTLKGTINNFTRFTCLTNALFPTKPHKFSCLFPLPNAEFFSLSVNFFLF